MRKLITLSLLFAAGLLTSGILMSTPTSGHKKKFFTSSQRIAGSYIVVLNEDLLDKGAMAPEVESEAQLLSSVYGGDVKALYTNALKGYSVTMSEQQAELLSYDDRVRSVEEDGVMYAATTQSNAPWNLDRVDQRNLPLTSTFDYSQAGAGAHIYILDTGIRVTHNEFGGRASVVFDALNDGQNGIDCNGHGTHVAGTAAGATYGAAKSAFVHSVRVLPCAGGGQISDLIAAVDWLTAHRINPAVANISITAPGDSPAMESAIANSIASGITFTIAAGNAAWDACDYTPARTPSAITVGATANDDFRPNYSNFGSCVDIYAPGHAIVSAGIASNTATNTLNGTSMAAPLVAGVAAVYRAANPSANPTTVAAAIVNSATTGVVTNLDPASPNKLLYSWLGSTPPAPTPTPTVTPTPSPTATPTSSPTPTASGSVSVKKRVVRNGGPSAITVFPYQAQNLSTANFTLVDNQEFADPSVPAGAQIISVTEANVPGMRLTGVSCSETGGQSVPNTTVDLANHRANIVVDGGESVTCTFTSEEIVPTAARVVVAGKVTDARGRGVRGVSLTLFNATDGTTLTAYSNAFGFYSFSDVEVGHFYVLTAYTSKRFRVLNNTRTFTLTDAVLDMNFEGE